MSWPAFWLKDDWRSRLLSPLAALVARVATKRYLGFKQAKRAADTSQGLASPASPLVLVVGNLVVGGSGKTPLISWLIPLFQAQGWRVGVIARGYASATRYQPERVTPVSDPVQVGDEPLMLAQAFDNPIVVCRDRAAALAGLLAIEPVDIVISDDGLQHYGLARDLELVVFDASRPNAGIGNGRCLPAGPLRESLDRLQDIDFVLFNRSLSDVSCTPPAWLKEGPRCFDFQLQLGDAYALTKPNQTQKLTDFIGQPVYAVAGMGHPERFFAALTQAGLAIEPHSFSDHHPFTEQDFACFDPAKPLLMTSKDAVKCQKFARSNWWVCPVEVKMADDFAANLLQAIRQDPRFVR
ncbi:tetraacyldisaccharide 4'-kinase [Thiomicrospira sp. ALE5]|uniref:tetraacyldisaccharide 4'-kinase n=1 Tax=Thiomicrospira sp. ALE5 TaxID=748650 RepID=UPI0008EDA45D|nr:tetraacyldisaccharide 4'-kinase [Thiomicrospira sp. ALE5]SFR51799.1 lipid-A-disaccharide kinase [Thiomicrospira sp. ALE5]